MNLQNSMEIAEAPAPADRRRHFRLPVALPLEIAVPAVPGRRLQRLTTNVSAGGLYFPAREDDPIRPGQSIRLRISLPAALGRMASEAVLEADATVLRTDPTPTGRGVACAFAQPLRFG